jgi:hypothetical protein
MFATGDIDVCSILWPVKIHAFNTPFLESHRQALQKNSIYVKNDKNGTAAIE